MSGGLVTFGRATDNIIAFPNDSNVSRYHAEIEERGGRYFITDLGSSNGTTVNGSKVTGSVALNAGDTIEFGGTSRVEVEVVETDDADPDASASGSGPSIPMGGSPNLPSTSVATAAAGTPTSGPGMLIAAGVVCGLAVVCIAAAGFFY